MKKKSIILKSSIINSILLLIFGILLIAQSEATILTISYIIGGILVAIGAIAVLKFIKNIDDLEKSGNGLDIVYGVVCVIMGILVIRNPQTIASIIPFIIGIIIIINSATKLQYSLELKRQENDLWTSTLILSIVMSICGVTLIFNPFKGAVFLTRIVGIFILIYSILDLISTMVIRNSFKKVASIVEENIKDAEVIEENTDKEEDPEEIEEEKKENKVKRETKNKKKKDSKKKKEKK